MINFKIRFSGLILLCALCCSSILTFGQVSQHVEVTGKVRKDNKPLAGVTIQISAPGAPSQTVTSKDNGSFSFELDLQKTYSVVYSKEGLVPKLIEFSTKLPPDQADIIYSTEYNVDLFEDVAGVSKKDAMTKPVARYSYNPTYEDFVYDENYSRQIKSEQDVERRAAEELNRIQERARLDSLNRIWNDSLAKLKGREAELAAANAEREKARQDSIAKANKALQMATAAAAMEKQRADSISLAQAKAQALADAREKARTDSIAKAEADKKRIEEQMALREQASRDSMAKAMADRNRLDSLAKAKSEADAKAKQEAEARQLEKNRLDSINKAEAAASARQKFVSDSIASAKRSEAEAKVKAEADARMREKARLDSISKAELALAAREKFVSDSTAKANAASKQAEEEARLKEKQKADSIAAALAAAKAREKFVADSTTQAKIDQDKKSADDKAALEAANKLKEKQRADSISAAAVAEKARQKEIADSTAKAQADAKAKADAQALADKARQKEISDSTAKAQADAKAKADAEALARDKRQQDSLALMKENELKKSKEEAEARQQKLAEDKMKQDSAVAAQKALAEKEEADRKAKVLAEIEAKKQMLAKSNTTEGKTATPAKAVTAVPKIKDSDYRDGVTEETITETNRTIYRTVVKKDGFAYNYQKLVYSWGGVFYYKNDNTITQSTFEQELKTAKEIK